MKNKNKLPSALIITILSLITLLTWVSFSIIREYTKTAAPIVPPEVLLPLDPKLDANTINEMDKRLYP